MNALTLDEQFLSSLEPSQKGWIRDYYRLITSPSPLDDRKSSRICEIWQHAENDETLLKWLEFIDYFYTDVDENDLPDDASRAYLSEYLLDEVGRHVEETNKFFLLVLECPHGQGRTIVPWFQDCQEAVNSSAFRNQICEKCNHKYEEHMFVKGAVAPNI